MNEITVHVVRRKGKNLYLRFTDPVTGKRHEKNSGTTSQRKAQRAAGEWQAELNQGIDHHGKMVRWADFRQLRRRASLPHEAVNNHNGGRNFQHFRTRDESR